MVLVGYLLSFVAFVAFSTLLLLCIHHRRSRKSNPTTTVVVASVVASVAITPVDFMPPPKQKQQREQLANISGDIGFDTRNGQAASVSNARNPFRESETMELKTISSSAVDADGYSIQPSHHNHQLSRAPDSDEESDGAEARKANKLRSLRIRDKHINTASSTDIAVEFLDHSDVRRSRNKDAWLPESGSQTSTGTSTTNRTGFGHEHDDWASADSSPRRIKKIIDVPICEKVVPPPVDGVLTDKLKAYLRHDNVRIWLLPFSDERGDGHIPEELLRLYSTRLGADFDTVSLCMERLRILTFNRKVRRLAAAGITVAHIEVEETEFQQPQNAVAPTTTAAASAANTASGGPLYDVASTEINFYSIASNFNGDGQGANIYDVAESRPSDHEYQRISLTESSKRDTIMTARPTLTEGAPRDTIMTARPTLTELNQPSTRDTIMTARPTLTEEPPLFTPTRPTNSNAVIGSDGSGGGGAAHVTLEESPIMHTNYYGNYAEAMSKTGSGYMDLGSTEPVSATQTSSAAPFADSINAAQHGYLHTMPESGPSLDEYLQDDLPRPQQDTSQGYIELEMDNAAPKYVQDAYFNDADLNANNYLNSSIPVEQGPYEMPIDTAYTAVTMDQEFAVPTDSYLMLPSVSPRSSAIAVSAAAGGDQACEGFVPQLFRPSMCSLCFRERSMHKGMS